MKNSFLFAEKVMQALALGFNQILLGLTCWK